MNVLMLDESRKRGRRLGEMLEQRRHTVTACLGSGEFFEAIAGQRPDRVVLDVESWKHGSSIYRHFDMGRRLEETPIVFFNAPEGFTTIAGRRRHDLDRVVSEEAELDAVVEAVG